MTQNTGCTIEKEVSTQVTAPSSYSIAIKNSVDYLDCEKSSETLSIDSFEAIASLGTTTIPSNIGVTYQWFKNNTVIIGATSTTYTISSYLDNGIYRIEAKFTDGQTVVSNNLNVRLQIDESLNVTSDGSILCNTNASVTLTSSVTNPIYTYQWFKENEATVLGTNTTYERNRNRKLFFNYFSFWV